MAGDDEKADVTAGAVDLAGKAPARRDIAATERRDIENRNEPRRESRRLFCLSQATIAISFSCS